MKNYICKRACTLNGTKVVAGEAIPHDLLMASRIPKLVSLGLIEEAPASKQEPAQIQREAPPARETVPQEEEPAKTPKTAPKRQQPKAQKAGS